MAIKTKGSPEPLETYGFPTPLAVTVAPDVEEGGYHTENGFWDRPAPNNALYVGFNYWLPNNYAST